MQKFLADKIAAAAQRVLRTHRPVQDWGADLPHAQRIQAAYRCVLDRAGEPEGVAHWERHLARGDTFDQLLQNFLKSPEFQRRLAEYRADGETWQVRAAYRCLLGREPEIEGHLHWKSFLGDGGRLQDMLTRFIRSAEFTRRLNKAAAEGATVAEPVAPVEAAIVEPQAAPEIVVEPAPEPEVVAPVVARKRFAVIGNCQSANMIRCVQALTGSEFPTLSWSRPDLLVHTEEAHAQVIALFAAHEKVFIQPAYWDVLAKRHPEFAEQVILYPSVAFAAFHPDVVYVSHRVTGEHVFGPCHDYQSSIAFLGWKAGLPVERTLALFDADIYQRLGFFDTWQPSLAALIEEGRAAGLELAPFVDAWRRRGNFMLSMNHPKLFVLLDIARAVLEKHGIPTARFDLEDYVYDWTSVGAVWPVYPVIGERLGAPGHFHFKLEAPALAADRPVQTMGLKEYVEASYRAFSAFAKDDLVCDRLQSSRYQRVLDDLLASSAAVPDAAAKGPSVPDVAGAALKCAVLGNAQARGLARCLQALLGGDTPIEEHVTAERLADWESGRSSLVAMFSAHDKVFMQPWIWSALATRYGRFESKVVLYPSIAFMAYQPDVVDIQIRSAGAALTDGPLGRCHSSIALLGWKAGLNVSETVALFRGDVLQRLGLLDWWNSSELALLEEGRAAGLPLEKMLARWKEQGCFMHFPAHPRLFVLADIARALLEQLGVAMRPFDLTAFAHDHLGDGVAWPVYPELARQLGCRRGSYEFKQRLLEAIDYSRVNLLGVEQLVAQSFAVFDRYPRHDLTCRRLNAPEYRDALKHLQESRTLPAAAKPIEKVEVQETPSSASGSSHPYAGLPPHRFWRKAVQSVRPDQVDPVVSTRFKIRPETKVATAGSCFALNISRRLLARGYNFLQAEPGPEGPREAVEGVGGMGLFSARFGYVYTARQLRQLMDRAYGRFVPDDTAWTLPETGRFVDPFRPRVEPDGFASVADVEQARALHLAAVRRMFETLDVMVFTLGMTEAWRARSDGAVFSVAPGVAGGQMDFERYEFVNFTVAEVDADLQAFIEALRQVNPRARVILTVSPVPILATYADRHVMVSSTYTKSVLRVAADQIVQRHDFCDYFPGYELVNSSFHRGSYIAEDLRSVTSEGIDHVMRLFFAHYAGDGETVALDAEMLAEARKNLRVVCDEELLDAAMR